MIIEITKNNIDLFFIDTNNFAFYLNMCYNNIIVTINFYINVTVYCGRKGLV